jgi:hypothetical protein
MIDANAVRGHWSLGHLVTWSLGHPGRLGRLGRLSSTIIDISISICIRIRACRRALAAQRAPEESFGPVFTTQKSLF